MQARVRSLLKQPRPGLTSSPGSPMAVGMEPGTPGWHASSGATCPERGCPRAGEEKTLGGNRPPRLGWNHPSLAFSKGCFHQKEEQRDEKLQVGRGNGQVPPGAGAGKADPKCPEVEPSAWSLTVLLPRDEHVYSNPVIYGCLSPAPPREPAPALLLPFSPSFSRGCLRRDRDQTFHPKTRERRSLSAPAASRGGDLPQLWLLCPALGPSWRRDG